MTKPSKNKILKEVSIVWLNNAYDEYGLEFSDYINNTETLSEFLSKFIDKKVKVLLTIEEVL